MEISFYKMSGTGNDFIIFDSTESKKVEKKFRKQWVKSLCQRKTSIGADGVIFMEDNHSLWNWDFYNADGSAAEMCGNGARCMGLIYFKSHPENNFKFQSLAGEIETYRNQFSIDDRKITIPQNHIGVKMPLIHDLKMDLNKNLFTTDSLKNDINVIDSFSYLNTGVPHIVCEVKNLENINLSLIGPYLRNHSEFLPQGANVTFFTSHQKDSLYPIRVYERGVEGETLACGTGATAAAFVIQQKYKVSSPIQIKLKGGNLNLIFNGYQPYLIGKSEITYWGKTIIQDLNNNMREN